MVVEEVETMMVNQLEVHLVAVVLVIVPDLLLHLLLMVMLTVVVVAADVLNMDQVVLVEVESS